MFEASQMVQTVSKRKEASFFKADKPLPLLKWAGGKEQELSYIIPRIPSFRRYYEPFVGGGAVFFSVPSEEKKYINDKSHELINLYRMVAENNFEFFHTLEVILGQWQRICELVDTNAENLIALYNVYSKDGLCWLLGSSVQKNGFSGDSDGGYLFVLEDRYSLVEKFNSHPVCLSTLDKLSLSPRLYSSRGNSRKEMK